MPPVVAPPPVVVPPPVGAPPPAVGNVFPLREISFWQGQWGPPSQFYCRSSGSRSGSRRVEGGELRLEGEQFSFVLADSSPGSPVPHDTLRLSGPVERYGPLLLLHAEGDTLFAAVGPDPEAPTTVVLSDPYGVVGSEESCSLYRFVAPQSSPSEVVVGGESEADLVIEEVTESRPGVPPAWSPLPFSHTGGNRHTFVQWTVTSGRLALRSGGAFRAELQYTKWWDGVVTSGTAVGTGPYAAGGPLVAFSPGTRKQTFGVIGAGGMLTIYYPQHMTSFTPGDIFVFRRQVRLRPG